MARKLEQARQSLELATVRFNRGIASNLDQIESEKAFADAEIEVIEQKINYTRKVVNLAHVLGVLTPEWLEQSIELGATHQQAQN